MPLFIMLDLDIIEKTIDELENAETNFFNCRNLASLYIVRDRMIKESKLDKELFDIIPAYKNYCNIKKSYQLKELPKESIINAISSVCGELQDFITTLYNNTDDEEERKQIFDVIQNLYNMYKSP